MVEAKLPADDSADHEQPRTTENDRGEENDDLGVGRGRRVRREGELWVGACEGMNVCVCVCVCV